MYELLNKDHRLIPECAYSQFYQQVVDESCRDQMDNGDKYIHFMVCFEGMHSEVLIEKTEFVLKEDEK